MGFAKCWTFHTNGVLPPVALWVWPHSLTVTVFRVPPWGHTRQRFVLFHGCCMRDETSCPRLHRQDLRQACPCPVPLPRCGRHCLRAAAVPRRGPRQLHLQHHGRALQHGLRERYRGHGPGEALPPSWDGPLAQDRAICGCWSWMWAEPAFSHHC